MQIVIGNSIIPSQGTSLPLVLRSPLFSTSENKIPGSYIFNSSLPASDALCKEFAQAQRIQRHGRATAELPYTITSGVLRFSGFCIVTQYESNQFEIAFLVNNGDFSAKLFGKTLKDLNLGGDQVISSTMCSGQNAIGFSPSQSEAEPFANSVDLEFISLIVDNNSSFIDQDFIAQFDELLDIVFYFDLYIVNATWVRLEIYKNDILTDYSEIIAQNKELHKQIAVEIGDKLNFKLSASSALSQHEDYRIDYSFTNYLFEILSNNNLFCNNDAYAVFPVHNTELLSNFPDDAFMLDNTSIKTLYTNYFPVVNYYKNGRFPLFLQGKSEDVSFTAANLFVPFVYLNKLLDQIIKEAGFTVINSPFTTDFSGAVLFNMYAENTYGSNLASVVPIKSTFNLSDHVPAIPQSDFLNWVSFLTGFYPVVDNNELTVTFVDCKNVQVISNDNPPATFPGILLADPKITIEPQYKGIKFELKKAGPDKYLGTIKELHSKLVYKGEVAELNQLPASGNLVNDMYLVTKLNEYYVFQYNPETYSLTWWFYSKKFPLVYSEGTEPFLQLTSELCPVLTARIEDETLCAPENRFWILPKTEQAGILEGFPDSLGSEYGYQVLYYKGMSLDSLGQPYPLGTSRLDDYTGNPLLFPDLNADSLFENRYKEFLQWLAYDAKPATFKAILTTAQLKQIKFDQIYSGNGFHFLIKEIRVNMQIDGLSVAELDIYSC